MSSEGYYANGVSKRHGVPGERALHDLCFIGGRLNRKWMIEAGGDDITVRYEWRPLPSFETLAEVPA